MSLRSLLFIPGDSEKKLAKGDASGADALILDLEDSVTPARKAAAREMAREYLSARKGVRAPQVWVRVNPLESGLVDADLAAIVAAGPDGIMQPKANGPQDVAALSAKLDALGAPASVRILPVATETPIAPFKLGEYASAKLARLYGLTWGAEDLSAALGASTNRDASGQFAFTYQMVRSLTLLGAHAAGVEAIDTLHANFADEAGLRASSRAARVEGFSGRLAIHPAQVPVINESFTPSDDEVAHARQVVDAFAAEPDAGVVSLDGRMLDAPHLKQAQRVLALAEKYKR